jgi:hypothetical protein
MAQARGYQVPYSNTNPAFDAILRRLGELHDRKNAGYANNADPLANFRIANRFGISTSDSIAVRLSDKINRWLNLMGEPELDKVGESLDETADDMAVYIMLWLVARDEERGTGATVVASDPPEPEDFWDHMTIAWTPEQYSTSVGREPTG